MGRAVALLGESREVGLVLYDDVRAREAFVEGGDEAAVPGGQAGGVAEFARGRVDEAGGADTDGVEVFRARLLRGPLHQRDGLLDRGPRTRRPVDRHGRLREHPPDQVGDDDGDAL